VTDQLCKNLAKTVDKNIISNLGEKTLSHFSK